MQFLKSLFGPTQADHDAHTLYVQLIDQARKPAFFRSPFNAPDNMEGRFEVILLHLALLDHFLNGLAGSETLRRDVQELLIRDMDRSLRELGIGDMSIGKQMKKVGAGMLGRLNSYEAAIAADDETKTTELVAAIIDRNIDFAGENGSSHFARYFWTQLCALNAMDTQAWSLTDCIYAEIS